MLAAASKENETESQLHLVLGKLIEDVKDCLDEKPLGTGIDRRCVDRGGYTATTTLTSWFFRCAMPRTPDLTTFQCESCQTTCHTSPRKDRHLLPWLRRLPIKPDGTCRKCGGQSWKITLVYAESDLQVSSDPLRILFGLFTLSVPIDRSAAAAGVEYAGVSAETVATLNSDPRMRSSMIAEYANAAHKIEKYEQGAKNCRECDAIYIPSSDLPWTQRGYCSKLCLVRRDSQSALVQAKANSAEVSSKTVFVTCADGHEFAVAKSFRGTKRPCPVCGLKTPVPVG